MFLWNWTKSTTSTFSREIPAFKSGGFGSLLIQLILAFMQCYLVNFTYRSSSQSTTLSMQSSSWTRMRLICLILDMRTEMQWLQWERYSPMPR